jgi:hypothetical protein
MSLTYRAVLGFAFIAVMFLLLVFGSVVHHTQCHGQCRSDRKCQERCLEQNYCPYGE